MWGLSILVVESRFLVILFLWPSVSDKIVMLLAVVTDRSGSRRAIDELAPDEVLRVSLDFWKWFVLGILARPSGAFGR